MLPLALSGDQWIALAGVVVGAVVGVVVGGAGLVFAYFNGKREREHGERLARSGRLHAQRHDAYVKVAAQLERQRLFVVRTEPFLGPVPDPPPPLDDDEWTSIAALAAVSPSPEVVAALGRARDETRNFEIAVVEQRHKSKTAEGPEMTNAYEKQESSRQSALSAINETERIMREELAEL